MPRRQIIPPDGRHRRLAAQIGMRVGRIHTEHQPAKIGAGHKCRLVPRPPQIRQPFPPHPLQLVLGKTGVARHIRRQPQRVPPVPMQRLGGQQRNLLARLRGQPRSDMLKGRRQLLTAAARRPLRQHRGGERRQPRQPRRIPDRPAPRQQRKGHQRRPRLARHNNLHPVAQRRPPGTRRHKDPRRPPRRLHPAIHARRCRRRQPPLRQHSHPHLPRLHNPPVYPPHIRLRNLPVVVHHPVQPLRVAGIDIKIVQRIGAPPETAHPRQRPVVLHLNPVDGALHLLVRRRLPDDAVQHLGGGGIHLLQRMPGGRRQLHPKLPRNLGGVIPNVRRLRDLPLINQRPIQPAALPVRQNGPQNVGGIIILRKVGRRQPHRIGTG